MRAASGRSSSASPACATASPRRSSTTSAPRCRRTVSVVADPDRHVGPGLLPRRVLQGDRAPGPRRGRGRRRRVHRLDRAQLTGDRKRRLLVAGLGRRPHRRPRAGAERASADVGTSVPGSDQSSARSSAAGIEFGATRAAAAATARSRMTAFTGVGIPCSAPTRTTSPLNASASMVPSPRAIDCHDDPPPRCAPWISRTCRRSPRRAASSSADRVVDPRGVEHRPRLRARPTHQRRPRRRHARRSPRPRCRGSSAASCTSTASRRAPRGRRSRRAPRSATSTGRDRVGPARGAARCRTAPGSARRRPRPRPGSRCAAGIITTTP